MSKVDPRRSEAVCKVCGNKFAPQSHNKAVYCSAGCYREATSSVCISEEEWGLAPESSEWDRLELKRVPEEAPFDAEIEKELIQYSKYKQERLLKGIPPVESLGVLQSDSRVSKVISKIIKNER